MEKSAYQFLRSDVESEIVNFDPRVSDTGALVNSIMRLFLQASSAEQVRNQRARRDFLTFRRYARTEPPSWAYIEPGISDRLPKL